MDQQMEFRSFIFRCCGQACFRAHAGHAGQAGQAGPPRLGAVERRSKPWNRWTSKAPGKSMAQIGSTKQNTAYINVICSKKWISWYDKSNTMRKHIPIPPPLKSCICVGVGDIPHGEEVLPSAKALQIICHRLACKTCPKPNFQKPTYFPTEVFILGTYLDWPLYTFTILTFIHLYSPFLKYCWFHYVSFPWTSSSLRPKAFQWLHVVSPKKCGSHCGGSKRIACCSNNAPQRSHS